MLSDDPKSRERQLANLDRGRGRTSTTFAPGNTVGQRHGMYGRVLPEHLEPYIATVAEELELVDEHGRVPARHRRMVELIARSLHRIDLADKWLDEHGMFDEHGAVYPAAIEQRREREQARKLLSDLGMSPRAAAALGLTIVQAASAEAQLGAIAAEHAERRAATVDGH